VDVANDVTGPWNPAKNLFTTGNVASATLPLGPGNVFFRPMALDLSNGRAGFTNLVHSFDLLTTIAGTGGPQDVSNWRPEFEGGPATSAVLSGPHFAMADRAGNIYIADKDAHGIRKLRTDGTIITAAGSNVRGNGGDEPAPATSVDLNEPNGLWVRGDGTVYILDLMNGKVRRLDTNGMLSTFFTVPGGIAFGRGLWVSDDESVAYVSSGTVVKKWTPTNITDFATGFSQLGNLVVDPGGNVVVTDRFGHRVWRLDENGGKTAIAGNGTASGGGDGQLALQTGLEEVRGVWFLPSGAYFVCTHRGSQVWYVDTDGFIHLFLNGHRSDTHAGDGTWFYNPAQFRVSENRAVTMDYDGNLLITEHDAGYVRKVQFLRHVP
jgi:sugar lactone lactonase YvrE